MPRRRRDSAEIAATPLLLRLRKFGFETQLRRPMSSSARRLAPRRRIDSPCAATRSGDTPQSRRSSHFVGAFQPIGIAPRAADTPSISRRITPDMWRDRIGNAGLQMQVVRIAARSVLHDNLIETTSERVLLAEPKLSLLLVRRANRRQARSECGRAIGPNPRSVLGKPAVVERISSG
jgi:hypothetical protein